MITTREIDVNLKKAKLKHRQVTTKNINAGVRVEPPKEPIKPRSVTTATLPDVADIAEKKRRDDIMAEMKKAKQTETLISVTIMNQEEAIKKNYQAVEVKVIEPIETITHPVAKDIKAGKTISGEQEVEVDTAGEKKAAMRERMAKVRAAKKGKK